MWRWIGSTIPAAAVLSAGASLIALSMTPETSIMSFMLSLSLTSAGPLYLQTSGTRYPCMSPWSCTQPHILNHPAALCRTSLLLWAESDALIQKVCPHTLLHNSVRSLCLYVMLAVHHSHTGAVSKHCKMLVPRQAVPNTANAYQRSAKLLASQLAQVNSKPYQDTVPAMSILHRLLCPLQGQNVCTRTPGCQ